MANIVLYSHSGYVLNAPSTTVDSNRPAYGGTCYSAAVQGSTYTVTAYNASTLTATQAWPATTSLDQFYAHVIEGYALELKAASVSHFAPASRSPPIPLPHHHRPLHSPSFSPPPTTTKTINNHHHHPTSTS